MEEQIFYQTWFAIVKQYLADLPVYKFPSGHQSNRFGGFVFAVSLYRSHSKDAPVPLIDMDWCINTLRSTNSRTIVDEVFALGQAVKLPFIYVYENILFSSRSGSFSNTLTGCKNPIPILVLETRSGVGHVYAFDFLVTVPQMSEYNLEYMRTIISHPAFEVNVGHFNLRFIKIGSRKLIKCSKNYIYIEGDKVLKHKLEVKVHTKSMFEELVLYSQIPWMYMAKVLIKIGNANMYTVRSTLLQKLTWSMQAEEEVTILMSKFLLNQSLATIDNNNRKRSDYDLSHLCKAYLADIAKSE